jgi:hypothetical protein
MDAAGIEPALLRSARTASPAYLCARRGQPATGSAAPAGDMSGTRRAIKQPSALLGDAYECKLTLDAEAIIARVIQLDRDQELRVQLVQLSSETARQRPPQHIRVGRECLQPVGCWRPLPPLTRCCALPRCRHGRGRRDLGPEHAPRPTQLRDNDAPNSRDRRRIARPGSLRAKHYALNLRAPRPGRPRTGDGGVREGERLLR